MEHNAHFTRETTDEITLRQIILTVQDFKKYLLSKWKVLLIITCAGALVGALYSYLSARVYIAEANFVFEEAEGNESGGLALLGVGGEQVSLFQGDNLIWLYKSQSMLSKTLLAEVDAGKGSKKLLINWLIDIDPKVKKKANQIKESGITISFPKNVTVSELGLGASKLLLYATNVIRRDYLTVENVNKTMGVISVKLESEDELFAKSFVDHIVASVNAFYIQTKTKKTADQVSVLSEKVKEFNSLMNRSMQQVASSLDNVPYANPSRQSLKVSSQYKSVDVQVSSSMYSQMMQQLEMAKITLAKETPLIQVVDAPILPLPTEKPGLIKFIIIFGILASIFTIMGLFIKWNYRNIMRGGNHHINKLSHEPEQ